MGIKTLIMILASLSFSVSALADHHEGGEKKPFSIYGDFTTSMQFHDNENNNTGGNPHDDFNIDLVEINLEKNWSKSKLHLSIGYGGTATAVNSLATTSSRTLNIMNAYYHMNTDYGLGFMIGKFESPVGHETYNHMDNSQYTRSFGFAMAPIFSTGAALNYGKDMWNVGLIVSNGSGADGDSTTTGGVRDSNKTLALVIDVDPMENLSFDLNYVTGTEGTIASTLATPVTNQITILDFSAAFMINEMFDVALNYINGSQNPSGVGGTESTGTSIAAYVNANLGMFGLGLRYEMFDYDAGFGAYNLANTTAPGYVYVGNAVTGADNSISSITLAANAEIDQNAMFVLEYRMDTSDDRIWTDKDGVAGDSQNTITAAVEYRF